MPCLHSPSVATSVPSMSMRAWSKNAGGCSAQTFMRVSLKTSSSVRTSCGLEAAAEIAGRGRIGNAAGAEGVEEDFVVAAQFEVLQAGAVAQGVVGEVQHVVGLVIRQMDLEQVQAPVDGLGQAQLPDQQQHRADAAVSHAARALGDLDTGCCGRQHRPIAALRSFDLVQPLLDPPLAGRQLTAYLGVHSKSLRGCDVAELDTHETPQKRRGISVF